MTLNDLKAAIERRGFLIRLWLPDEDRVRMIVMMADRSMAWDVSLEDLDGLVLDTKTLIESGLGRLTNHQHFVWCSQCHEPLLRHTDHELALKYLQQSTKPDAMLEVVNKTSVASIVSRLNAGMPVFSKDVRFVPGINGKEAIERATVYRSAKAGPDSPMLSDCPKCGVLLDGNTSEIED